MPDRKQPRAEGSTAFQWLYDLGVKQGDFYTETKARARSVAKDPSWPEKARVWAFLALCTMGFQTELAVKLVKGKPVPVTRKDIADGTGMEPAQVRRGLVQLEQEGKLVREPLTEGGKLERDNIQIRCFAIPREPVPVPENGAPAKSEVSYDGIPERLQTLFRHYKVRDMAGFDLAQAVAAAEKLAEVEREFLAVVKPPSQSKSSETTPKKRVRAKPSESATGTRANVQGYARNRSGVRAPTPEPKTASEIHKVSETPVEASETASRVLLDRTDRTDNKRGAGRQVEDAACLPACSLLLQAITDTGITAKLRDTPGPALLRKIAAQLNGAPVEYLKNRIHARFDEIKSLGILESLAADVAASQAPEWPKAKDAEYYREHPEEFYALYPDERPK